MYLILTLNKIYKKIYSTNLPSVLIVESLELELLMKCFFLLLLLTVHLIEYFHFLVSSIAIYIYNALPSI